MRIKVYGKDTGGIYAIKDLAQAIEHSRSLNYSSAIPGGMAVATVDVPYPVTTSRTRLNGGRLMVYDGIRRVWSGTITSVRESVKNTRGYVTIQAHGPWEQARREHFSADYEDAGNFLADDVLQVVTLLNVPDAQINSRNWDALATDTGAQAWGDADLQTVMSHWLKIGDTGTVPYTLLYYPAEPKNEGWLYSNDMMGHSTNATGGAVTESSVTTGSGVLTTDYGIYCKNYGSLKFTTGGDTAYKLYTFPATYTDLWCTIYLRLERSTYPDRSTNWIEFWSAANGHIAGLNTAYTTGYIIGVYNNTTTTYYAATGNQEMACGGWHKIDFRCKIGAGTGVLEVYFDNTRVLNQTGLNTGGTAIGKVSIGGSWDSGDDITGWIGGMIVHATRPGDAPQAYPSDFQSECRLKLVRGNTTINTPIWDWQISARELRDAYAMEESLDATANIVWALYSPCSDSDWVPVVTDKISLERYGPLYFDSVPQLSRTTDQTLTAYYRDRLLAQYKAPLKMLQPFTLKMPPKARYGTDFRLSLIRAGQYFSVRDRADIGNVLVGHTQFTRGDDGQSDTISVTPVQTPANLGLLMAMMTERTWA